MAVLPSFGKFTTLADLYARSRELFPTNLSSADIRQLDADLRRRSVFSARTTNAEYVQAIKDAVEGLMQGDFNGATARARLQDVLDQLQYSPDRGFPGDIEKGIPSAELGSLRDLSSEKRVKFMLDTQESLVANYGHWKAGQDDLARYQFPAYELVRIFTRKAERPDWLERFVRAGGTPIGDRMIAAKDDPVWEALGTSANFDDGLDNPYPPFAFGSGMGWRDVSREEAIALGVIAPDEIPQLQDKGLNDELKINAAQFDPEFLASVRADLQQALAA